MNHALRIFCLTLPLLSACAPINTEFSCNATAADRCLSIEEVNAMTEFHERKVKTSKQTVLLAPWKDANGVVHENDTVFIHP